MDVLFKPTTAASVTDAVQSKLVFQLKTTDDEDRKEKMGYCSMIVACESSALYHDRRRQRHATPKAMQ